MIHRGVVGLLALPAVVLAARAVWGDLGANPIETVTHVSGEWALRLLLLTLAVTPARRLLGWRRLAPYRRTFGLAAFAYATLHFCTWLGLDHFFELESILEDVSERPYVMVGLAAFTSLLPLAVTSTRRMVRRLGRRWITLHRLVYLAASLAVVHHLWLVKADLRAPLLEAAVLAVLLGARALPDRRLGARPRNQSSSA
jgi:sulfoxide reductase heme-binding subunit YedZ